MIGTPEGWARWCRWHLNQMRRQRTALCRTVARARELGVSEPELARSLNVDVQTVQAWAEEAKALPRDRDG